MQPLCYIRTPFKEKFGVPRQSLLIDEAIGELVFHKNDFYSEAFRGIEEFSHLWLIFEFHQVSNKSFNGLVRPPRLGGKKKLGVYATRSPHRPNRLGLSVVKFLGIKQTDKEIILSVGGVDLVDETPIFDIKPYIPYSDSIPGAHTSTFFERPQIKQVIWKEESELTDKTKKLIEKVIGFDPRPAFEQELRKEYGVSVAGYNVRFQVIEDGFEITQVTKE